MSDISRTSDQSGSEDVESYSEDANSLSATDSQDSTPKNNNVYECKKENGLQQRLKVSIAYFVNKEMMSSCSINPI